MSLELGLMLGGIWITIMIAVIGAAWKLKSEIGGIDIKSSLTHQEVKNVKNNLNTYIKHHNLNCPVYNGRIKKLFNKSEDYEKRITKMEAKK